MSAEVAIVAGAGSGIVGTAEEVSLDRGEKLKNTEPKDGVVSSHDDTRSEDAPSLLVSSWEETRHDLDEEHPAFAFRYLKNLDEDAGEDAGVAWRAHLAKKLNIVQDVVARPPAQHEECPKLRGGNISNLPNRLQDYDRVLYIPAGGGEHESPAQTGSTFFSNPKRQNTLIVDVLRARHSFGDFLPFWRTAMEALALGRCERVLIVGFGNGSGEEAELEKMRRYKHFIGEDLKRRWREWREVYGESAKLPFWLADSHIAFLDGTVLGERMEFLKGPAAPTPASPRPAARPRLSARRAQRLTVQEFYCGNDSSRFITRHYPWTDMVEELELEDHCLFPPADNVLLVRVSSARWGFEEMKKKVGTYIANPDIEGRRSWNILWEDYALQMPRTTTSENGGLVSPDVPNDWMALRGAEDAWFEYVSRQGAAEERTTKVWYLISQHAVAMPSIPDIFKENVGAIVDLASGPIPTYTAQNAATPCLSEAKDEEDNTSWEYPSATCVVTVKPAEKTEKRPTSLEGTRSKPSIMECLPNCGSCLGFLGKQPTTQQTTWNFFQTFPTNGPPFSLCATMGSMAVEPRLMAKLWAEMMTAVAEEAPDRALRLFVHAGTGGGGVNLKKAYTESLAEEFANWKGPSELVYHVSDRMQTNPRPFAKHCDVFFHQGSAGTQMDATRLRKPQLVMPYWLSFDHVPNALYVEKNNLGGFVDFYANLVNEQQRFRVLQRGRALMVGVYKQVAAKGGNSAPSKEDRKKSLFLVAVDEHAQNIRQEDAGTAGRLLDYLYGYSVNRKFSFETLHAMGHEGYQTELVGTTEDVFTKIQSHISRLHEEDPETDVVRTLADAGAKLSEKFEVSDLSNFEGNYLQSPKPSSGKETFYVGRRTSKGQEVPAKVEVVFPRFPIFSPSWRGFWLSGDLKDPGKQKLHPALRISDLEYKVFQTLSDNFYNQEYPGLASHGVKEVALEIGNKKIWLEARDIKTTFYSTDMDESAPLGTRGTKIWNLSKALDEKIRGKIFEIREDVLGASSAFSPVVKDDDERPLDAKVQELRGLRELLEWERFEDVFLDENQVVYHSVHDSLHGLRSALVVNDWLRVVMEVGAPETKDLLRNLSSSDEEDRSSGGENNAIAEFFATLRLAAFLYKAGRVNECGQSNVLPQAHLSAVLLREIGGELKMSKKFIDICATSMASPMNHGRSFDKKVDSLQDFANMLLWGAHRWEQHRNFWHPRSGWRGEAMRRGATEYVTRLVERDKEFVVESYMNTYWERGMKAVMGVTGYPRAFGGGSDIPFYETVFGVQREMEIGIWGGKKSEEDVEARNAKALVEATRDLATCARRIDTAVGESFAAIIQNVDTLRVLQAEFLEEFRKTPRAVLPDISSAANSWAQKLESSFIGLISALQELKNYSTEKLKELATAQQTQTKLMNEVQNYAMWKDAETLPKLELQKLNSFFTGQGINPVARREQQLRLLQGDLGFDHITKRWFPYLEQVVQTGDDRGILDLFWSGTIGAY